jgi:hypothetical protein
MDSTNDQQPDQGQDTGQSRPTPPPIRVSTLAIVAMVLACLPCPPMSLLGSVLGLLAMSRIRDAAGTLRGRMLAKVAIVVGLLMSLGGVLLLSALETEFNSWRDQAVARTVHVFLEASLNDNISGAITRWDVDATPISEAQVAAFGERIRQQLGEMKSLRVGKISPAGGGLSLSRPVDAWLLLEFDKGTFNGSARVMLNQSLLNPSITVRLQSLRIDDADGVLAIPPLEDEPPADSASEGDTPEPVPPE